MKSVPPSRELGTRNFEQLRKRYLSAVKNGVSSKQLLRWQHFWSRRLDASGNLPSGRSLIENWQQHLQLQLAPPSAFSWTPLGPTQLPDNEPDIRRANPGLGRVSCIAFAPGVMYAGAATGGLWKSIDQGASWTSVEVNLPLLGVGDIAIHPQDPSTIYLGTGDRDGNDAPGFGVMKSTDGGASFSQLTVDPARPSLVISRLLINPENPSIVLAAATGGIYSSTDDGDTWTLRADSDTFGRFFGMEYKPGDPSVVYASSTAQSAPRSPIIISHDGGLTWAPVSGGIPNQNILRVAIAVTPAAPDLLYAIFVNDNRALDGFYRSTDSGASWTLVSSKPNILGAYEGVTERGSQGDYDLALAISPTNKDEVFVGGLNVWKSDDGGKNWRRKSLWNRGHPTNRYVHADQHALAFFPGSSEEIWSCNDGGIFQSTDGGRNWVDRSNGLQISEFYTVATSPKSKAALLGSQDNGVVLFDGSKFRMIFGGDGLDGVFSHEDPETIFFVVFDSYWFRSKNLGKINNEVTENVPLDDFGSFDARMAIDPVDADIVYLGLRSLFRSKTNGRRWKRIRTLPDGTDTITAVRIAPTDPRRIYVSRGADLFTSADKGDSWNNVNAGLSGSPITDVAVDPDNPNHVWLTVSDSFTGRVFRSLNAGTTWQEITGPLPPASGSLPAFRINAIVGQSGSSNLVYVGTDVGVFLTHDGLAPNWAPYNTDLPVVVVSDLEIHPFTNKLMAATFGRGLWEAPLFVVPTFSLHLSTSNLRLVRNSNGIVKVEIRRSPPDFDGAVALAVEGLPAGVSHNFPPSLADIRTLNVGVGETVAFGSYNVLVTGTSGAIRSVAPLQLTIKNFILSLSEPGVILKGDDNQLKSASVTVTISRSPGFNDGVQLSIEGLPVGAPQGGGIGATINPGSTTGNTSTLNVSAGRFTPEAGFALTVRGVSGNLVDTVQLAVEVLASDAASPPGPVQS